MGREARAKRERRNVPGRLTRSTALVLVAHAIEEQLAEQRNVVVTFDAFLPDRSTGRLHQVDAAIRHDVGGRPMLGIVEVRDSAEEWDATSVVRIEDRARDLGAARATLVSSAGFGEAALERIRLTAHHLEAVHLQPARDADWPERLELREIALQVGGRLSTYPLVGRMYHQPDVDQTPFFVAFAEIQRSQGLDVLTWVARADGRNVHGSQPYGVRLWVAALGSTPPRFTFTVRTSTGTREVPVRSALAPSPYGAVQSRPEGYPTV